MEGITMYLQPCDWLESDVQFKYVVDVYGRTNEGDVARLRIKGFEPYLYIQAEKSDSVMSIQMLLEKLTDKSLRGLKIVSEEKFDVMAGFNNFTPTKVWKISTPALWMFKTIARAVRQTSRNVYETNLPPLLRLFHTLDISPASPIKFEADPEDPDEDTLVDVCYTVNYKDVIPVNNINIPLYVAAYDIETYSSTGRFPLAENPADEIIQIGVSFRWNDKLLENVERYVFVSGSCSESKDPSVKFVSCANERDLLVKFQACIHAENPDVIAGYNTFGFDDGYIADRAIRHGIHIHLGRTETNWKHDLVKTESKTFELASGKFAVRYLEIPGRLTVDLLLSVRREQNLDSYKLDNVSSVFLRDKVTKLERLPNNVIRIHTKGTRGLFVGNLVRFDVVTNTVNPYRKGEKFPVIEIQPKSFLVQTDEPILDDLPPEHISKLEWSFTKDDVTAKEMFASHRGGPDDRAKIAKYCIQDCDLVLTLLARLDTLVNARGMADVCRVPITYIFLRGQGIKIYSAVVYNASKRNQILLTQESFEGDTSYEGAIVLPPKIGMYLNQPIPVLDFNSLYPSNMIAFNLSPDTMVYKKVFDANGRKIIQEGVEIKEGVDEISYDTHAEDGTPNGRVTCGFYQVKKDDPKTIGLLPLTLDLLLKMRKETRKKMETLDDDAQISVLNGLQLAYKVVANSVYGQTGSRTSPIRKLEVAACTTAAGRDRIIFAKSVVENEFGGQVIYGDTDSIFIKFPGKDLVTSMQLAKQSAARITAQCRYPYKIEYEKTFFPFILFCRKRYVGMMYEDDPNKCYRKSMGIALKRRDNAPIVKDIFGCALDILMEHRDIKRAQTAVKDQLVDLMLNKVPLEKFIITKQLRDDYKNPEQIAHRVLADRMEERDPGNKPQVGDRLSYIYVANRKDAKKQGDKIEHVDFVKQYNLKPDVEFYITNQVQNPVAQLFALAIEDLDGYVARENYSEMYEMYREKGMDEEDATLAVLKQKEKELDKMMFMGAQYLLKHRRGPMDAFLRR